MKETAKINKTGFFKKFFIKICRLLGYEIIDQSNFYVPTLKKSLGENLNILGKKSITVPMGEIRISRKISDFTIIFRSCTSVNMLTQSKKRLFDKNKSEYTFRSLNSILKAIIHCKSNLPNLNFNIIIVDHNSKKEDINMMRNMIEKFKIKYNIINLDTKEFVNQIKKTNSKNENVTTNQISNMSNIYKSLLLAKNECKDLIYLVEDDYIHLKDSFQEMIFTYEKIASMLKKEIILCPIDYPYLYNKLEPTNIILGASRHWRVVEESLCTLFTSKKMIINNWEKFTSMCKFEHYPFELPLHEIYKKEYCLSPIPSLAMHCTNINSAYGISPNLDWEKIWKDNEIN